MDEIKFQKMYKKLIYRFIMASILLLVVFLLKQIIVQYQIVQDKESSYVINIAGRQRMLSQKITKDLLLIQKNDDLKLKEYYKKELEESLELWEKSHLELLNLNKEEGFLNYDEEVLLQMFQDLEPSYKTICDTSNSLIVEMKKTDMSDAKMDAMINKVIEHEPAFLKQMDEIVCRYDYDAKQWLKIIQITHMVLFLIILCIVAFVVFVIFIPLIKYLKNSFQQENDSNKNLIKMLNASKGAVFIIQKDGEILFANRDAKKLIFSETDLCGHSFVAEQIKWINLDIMKTMEQVKDDESRLEDIEAHIMSKEGIALIHILSAVSCRYNNVNAIMVSLYDITAQKNAELALRNIAIKDELTGLYNRHFLDNIIDEEMERSDRYETPLSCALLDLDYFKKVNDQWGHPVGDSVLKFTAEILMKTIRLSDYAIRIGGEEFLVLMPNTDSKGAIITADKIRKAIKESTHPVIGQFTVSLGVAERNAGELYHNLYSRIDEALYEAKNKGRDCVVEAEKLVVENAESTLKWDESWN